VHSPLFSNDHVPVRGSGALLAAISNPLNPRFFLQITTAATPFSTSGPPEGK
jgi:hypothetical protein